MRSRTEATASGDRWIEDAWSKGKAVNAPQVPGHREFADILQQTYDNPYRCDVFAVQLFSACGVSCQAGA